MGQCKSTSVVSPIQITFSTKWTNADFIEACINGELETVRSAILESKEGKRLVMATDQWGYTALHWLCLSVGMGEKKNQSSPSSEIQMEIIELLVDVGGKKLVKARTKNDGSTALHWACENLLVDNASSNDASSSSSSPYVERIVRLLIDVGGEKLIRVKNHFGYTALHWACSSPFSTSSKNLKNPSPSATRILELLIMIGKLELVQTIDNNGNTVLDLEQYDVTTTEMEDVYNYSYTSSLINLFETGIEDRCIGSQIILRRTFSDMSNLTDA
jgi:ankyrin repeat protein